MRAKIDIDLIIAIILFLLIMGLWVHYSNEWLQRTADLLLGVVLGGLKAGMNYGKYQFSSKMDKGSKLNSINRSLDNSGNNSRSPVIPDQNTNNSSSEGKSDS